MWQIFSIFLNWFLPRRQVVVPFLAGVVKDIISGKLDTDGDGKVSCKEIEKYIADHAPEAVKVLL